MNRILQDEKVIEWERKTNRLRFRARFLPAGNSPQGGGGRETASGGGAGLQSRQAGGIDLEAMFCSPYSGPDDPLLGFAGLRGRNVRGDPLYRADHLPDAGPEGAGLLPGVCRGVDLAVRDWPDHAEPQQFGLLPGFASGFSLGNFLGVLIERKLAIGKPGGPYHHEQGRHPAGPQPA